MHFYQLVKRLSFQKEGCIGAFLAMLICLLECSCLLDTILLLTWNMSLVVKKRKAREEEMFLTLIWYVNFEEMKVKHRFNYRRIHQNGSSCSKEVHRWQYQWLTLRLLKLGDTFRILYPKSEKVRRAHTINNPQDDLKSASLLYIDRHHCGKLRLTVFKSIRLTCNFNRKYFCFCLAIGWKYCAIGVKKDYVVEFKN